jgi:multiple antibiotic resistance protein
MILIVVSFNFAEMVVTFLALIGPQKVLLSFARIAAALDVRSLRLVVMITAAAAACVETVCALTGPWIAKFFHISPPALQLAAGVVFFIYAVGMVFGLHFDPAESVHVGTPDDDADPLHPLTSGFRAMLLPFVVSPLAIAAALDDSVLASGWGARWAVAGAFAIVALIDAACAAVFAPLMKRTHETILEVCSRLLGILLAAVGVQLFLNGLTSLGVLHTGH